MTTKQRVKFVVRNGILLGYYSAMITLIGIVALYFEEVRPVIGMAFLVSVLVTLLFTLLKWANEP